MYHARPRHVKTVETVETLKISLDSSVRAQVHTLVVSVKLRFHALLFNRVRMKEFVKILTTLPIILVLARHRIPESTVKHSSHASLIHVKTPVHAPMLTTFLRTLALAQARTLATIAKQLSHVKHSRASTRASVLTMTIYSVTRVLVQTHILALTVRRLFLALPIHAKTEPHVTTLVTFPVLHVLAPAVSPVLFARLKCLAL